MPVAKLNAKRLEKIKAPAPIGQASRPHFGQRALHAKRSVCTLGFSMWLTRQDRTGLGWQCTVRCMSPLLAHGELGSCTEHVRLTQSGPELVHCRGSLLTINGH